MSEQELAWDDFHAENVKFVPDVSSGDGFVRTNEQMQEWADKVGCSFEVADPMTLFIDIDSVEQMKVFNANWHLADNLFNIGRKKDTVTLTESKSGLGHWHIRVKLREPISMAERICLQACLGSDLKREMISLKRAQAGEENVIVFFEKKEATT